MNGARQFGIFLENQPGRLAEVTATMAKAHVNIVGIDVVQATEHSVLRLVLDDPGRARSLLKREGIAFSENEVLVLDIENIPGALAEVAGKLARARINIEYAYGTTGAVSGRTRVILQVSDLMRARKVLEEHAARDANHPFYEKPRYFNREGRRSGRN